jgi:hypothetical protein
VTEGERGEDGAAEDEEAVGQGEVGEAHEDAGRERQFAAQRCQQTLDTRQQEEEEEEDESARRQHHEGRIGECGEQLAAQFPLLGEVVDEAAKGVAEVAGDLAGGDEVERGVVEDLRARGHRAGKRRALADAFPEIAAELAQGGILEALGKQADGLAGGKPARGEVVQGGEERQPVRPVETHAPARAAGSGGGTRRPGGGGGLDGGTQGGGVLVDAQRLETARGEDAQGVLARRRFQDGLHGLSGAVAGGVGEARHPTFRRR